MIRRGYLPPSEILSRSDKGFRFRACATSHTKLLGYFCFYHLQAPIKFEDATTPTDIDVGLKYVKRRGSALPRKDVPLRGSQNQNLTFTPPVPEKRHFGARFRWYLEIFGRKTALTLEVLRVNVIVAPYKLYSEYANWGHGFQICVKHLPLYAYDT